MKNIFFFAAFAAVIISGFSVPAFSEAFSSDPISVSISSERDAVYPGECNKYVAAVTNSGSAQRLDFSIDAVKILWLSLGDAYIDLNMTKKDVIFYICPDKDAASGTYNFVFKTKLRSSNATIENPVALYIFPSPFSEKKPGVELRDVLTSKPEYKLGESVEYTVNVKNLGESDVKNLNIVVELAGASAPEKQRLKIASINSERGSSVSGKFVFDRYKAHGGYTITAKIVDDIGDVLAQKSAKFAIEEKSELKQETIIQKKPLSKSFTLIGSNTGNKQDMITLKGTAFGYFALYSFEKQPLGIESSGENNVFQWVCNLAAGDSCTIKYEVEYWPLVVAIVLIVGIIYIVYTILEQPEIYKRIIKGNGVHVVHISIKNRSRKALKNVQVIDRIPEIVSVIPGSISPSVKPSVKGGKGGHELIWTFSNIAPNEERIIAYKIKPLVMLMGEVKLPKARITAVDAKGKKYSANAAAKVD